MRGVLLVDMVMLGFGALGLRLSIQGAQNGVGINGSPGTLF